MCKGNYDHDVIGVGNPDHPANQVTILPDEVEQMTELEFAEYERNLYQDRARAFERKLDEITAICKAMNDRNGLASIILSTIEK